MADTEMVARGDDETRFDSLFGALSDESRNGHPLYGEFGRRYYPAVHGERCLDGSFAIVAPDQSVAVAECNVLDGVVSRFGFPARALVAASGTGVARRLARAVVEQLVQVGNDHAAHAVHVEDDGTWPVLGPVGLACLSEGAVMHTRLHAAIDLSLPPEVLRADVRASVKSLLNWGARSLHLQYCNEEQPDRGLFDTYQHLHAKAAGRVTRPQASWDAMYETTVAGQGELVVAELDGDPIGGMLVVDGTEWSYYASGAWLRERFDLPLAHWPMMDAILRAKTRRMQWFDIGEIAAPGVSTEKERSIRFFKKAFTSRVEVRPYWELTLSDRKRVRGVTT